MLLLAAVGAVRFGLRRGGVREAEQVWPTPCPTSVRFHKELVGPPPTADCSFCRKLPRGVPPGCAVCCDPNRFERAFDRELICKSFWHVRYKSWPDCLAAARRARVRLRYKLCELCGAEPRQRTHASGVVYGMTGDSYLSQAARSIRVLRRFVNYTGPIEVHGAPGCREATEGLDVVCKPGVRTPVVGYAAKLIAVLASSFDNVLMLDTDNILFCNPEKLFAHRLYRESGALLWPDLWGAACLNNRWGVTTNNPTGQMLCGQTGWQDHVMWTVLDIDWRPERVYTQEHSDTQLAVDLTRFGVRLAVELGLWIAETEFGKNVLHGEKDAVRFGFLVAGVDFGYADGPNQLMVDEGGGFRRVLYQSTLDGRAITVDQVRSRPSERVHAVRARREREANGSTCSPDYERFQMPNDLVYIDEVATSDTRRYLEVINALY